MAVTISKATYETTNYYFHNDKKIISCGALCMAPSRWMDYSGTSIDCLKAVEGGQGTCLKQPHVLKLHLNDPCAFFALLRRFAARDHQFAGAEYEHYYFGLLDPVD